MPTVERSALVMHSVQQMYDLVNDVDRYKEFLPWCGDSVALEQSEEQAIASITIAFKGVHKNFTTRNNLTPPEQIQISLVDGPFRHLSGAWKFKQLTDEACKIELVLDYDFSNRLVGSVIGPVFRYIADSMVESFVKRADQIYSS